MGFIKAVVLFFRAMLAPRCNLAMENLVLRQQLSVYKQWVKRPKLRPRDRIFWVWLSRLWSNWRSALVIVQSEVHLKRILTLYFAYYHDLRPHLSLNQNSPTPRDVEPPCYGTVVSTPLVAGLHHRYSRAA